MFKIMLRSTYDQLVRERDQGDDYAVWADGEIKLLREERDAAQRELQAMKDDTPTRGPGGRFVPREPRS